MVELGSDVVVTCDGWVGGHAWPASMCSRSLRRVSGSRRSMICTPASSASVMVSSVNVRPDLIVSVSVVVLGIISVGHPSLSLRTRVEGAAHHVRAAIASNVSSGHCPTHSTLHGSSQRSHIQTPRQERIGRPHAQIFGFTNVVVTVQPSSVSRLAASSYCATIPHSADT